MKWLHRLDSSFRKELQSFGKGYSEKEKACDLMIKTLKELQKKTPEFKKFQDSVSIKEYKNRIWFDIHYNIQENISHFDFCKDFANNTITKEEWEDYEFDGDLTGLFNSYLREFWDICDTILNNKNRYDSDVEKFCWVEL